MGGFVGVVKYLLSNPIRLVWPVLYCHMSCPLCTYTYIYIVERKRREALFEWLAKKSAPHYGHTRAVSCRILAMRPRRKRPDALVSCLVRWKVRYFDGCE